MCLFYVLQYSLLYILLTFCISKHIVQRFFTPRNCRNPESKLVLATWKPLSGFPETCQQGQGPGNSNTTNCSKFIVFFEGFSVPGYRKLGNQRKPRETRNFFFVICAAKLTYLVITTKNCSNRFRMNSA